MKMVQKTLIELQKELRELLKEYPGYRCIIFHEDDKVVDVLDRW